MNRQICLSICIGFRVIWPSLMKQNVKYKHNLENASLLPCCLQKCVILLSSSEMSCIIHRFRYDYWRFCSHCTHGNLYSELPRKRNPNCTPFLKHFPNQRFPNNMYYLWSATIGRQASILPLFLRKVLIGHVQLEIYLYLFNRERLFDISKRVSSITFKLAPFLTVFQKKVGCLSPYVSFSFRQ